MDGGYGVGGVEEGVVELSVVEEKIRNRREF